MGEPVARFRSLGTGRAVARDLGTARECADPGRSVLSAVPPVAVVEAGEDANPTVRVDRRPRSDPPVGCMPLTYALPIFGLFLAPRPTIGVADHPDRLPPATLPAGPGKVTTRDRAYPTSGITPRDIPTTQVLAKPRPPPLQASSGSPTPELRETRRRGLRASPRIGIGAGRALVLDDPGIEYPVARAFGSPVGTIDPSRGPCPDRPSLARLRRLCEFPRPVFPDETQRPRISPADGSSDPSGPFFVEYGRSVASALDEAYARPKRPRPLCRESNTRRPPMRERKKYRLQLICSSP
jgi:hypothetical protein